jgi:hypothetical protein
LAGATDFNVSESIGGGGVFGQIITDGKTGALSQGDILGWKLQLQGLKSSTGLTSQGGQSGAFVQGLDLTATSSKLLFNFSALDTGYVLFQASNPGFGSGQHYYCLNTTWYGCYTLTH